MDDLAFSLVRMLYQTSFLMYMQIC